MRKILIVIPDCTRKAHLKIVLPRLLRPYGTPFGRRPLRGIPRNDVKIIVATGLHKPHSREELKKLVGKKIFSKYKVITHTQKNSDLIRRGTTAGGIPVILNRNLFEADQIITVGLIEPHLYAGYSGGAKTIAIGLAGEETINATHHPRFLDKAGTAIGSVENNPFQECLWEIIKGLPIIWSVSVINNRSGKLKRLVLRGLKGGIKDFKEGFNKDVKSAGKIFEKGVNKTLDVVICKVSPPKDVNMYQASRAFNYVLNVKRPIVKKGGMVLVCASLRDGFGKGTGEKKFAAVLKKMRSPEDLIKQVKLKGCVAGEHRAYMVAKAMMKARLGFIGPRAAFYTKGLKFLSFPNIKCAVRFIRHARGRDARTYRISNALSAVISSRRKF